MHRVIFLVNQVSRHGHLDLYARLYSACLLDLGYHVVLIAEHESGIGEWLATRMPIEARQRFTFLKRDDLHRAVERNARASSSEPPSGTFTEAAAIPPLPVRILRVWQKEGAPGLAFRCVFYGKLVLRLAIRVLGLAKATPGVSFAPVVQEILRAHQVTELEPDFIFFLYLDMMSEHRGGCRQLARQIQTPWGGILFHPRHDSADGAPVERYFRYGNARGCAFLNPHCIPPYRAALPRLTFGTLPDVTEISCAGYEVALVEGLRRQAAGRTIVLLVGSIAPHKGVVTFMEVIRRADPKEYFFAIVGEVFWDAFGELEEQLRAFAAMPPENCLFHPDYIANEAELNCLIKASDILYAVYTDFRDSSNSLTKVANFEKPILVSDEYLMGELVTRHRLGAVARPGDVDGIVAALIGLKDRPRSDYGFEEYAKLHSLEALRSSLGHLLAKWLPDSRDGALATDRAVPKSID